MPKAVAQLQRDTDVPLSRVGIDLRGRATLRPPNASDGDIADPEFAVDQIHLGPGIDAIDQQVAAKASRINGP
jgi:hypothetical protein